MPADNPFNEKREFIRFQCKHPVQYKVVYAPKGRHHASKVIDGVTKNLSAAGILFKTNFLPELSSIITLELDYRTTGICQEIEENVFIVGNTLIGKVVRIEDNGDGSYNIGIAFIRKTAQLPDEIKNILL